MSNKYIFFTLSITFSIITNYVNAQTQFETKEELQTAVNLWVSDNTSALATYGEINTWDVSLITDMSYLFRDKTTFNDDIGNWDVSSVTNMIRMFNNASSFNGDLSNWDVSSVVNMSSMFGSAGNFNGDISSWDVSSVTNMNQIFNQATSFNGDISNWNVSSVTDMTGVFFGAGNFNGDISSWDVSSVTNMNVMFAQSTIFNGDISSWDVSSVTNMNQMFSGTSAFNQNLSTWDVSSLVYMHRMFAQSTIFNGDLSSWNVSSVIDMGALFYFATSFNQDISAWDVSSVTDMSEMFDNANALSDIYKCFIDSSFSTNEIWPYNWSDFCDAYTYIPDDNFEQALIDLGYDDVLDDSVMTLNINAVTELDVSSKEISDLTGIENFISLEILKCANNQLTNLNVSNNTSLTYLRCGENQLYSLDVSNNPALTYLNCRVNQLYSLDVSNNTDLESLNCENNQLTALDVSNNPALSYLNCYINQLTALDVSANTALTTLSPGHNQLTTLDVSNNTALTALQCNNNLLTSLDVSANTELTFLYCYSNQLTSLDLRNNPELLDIKCQYNDLSSLNLKGRHPSEYATIEAFENWSLECVDVLDPEWAFYNWEEYFDRDVQFEFICGSEGRSQWHVSVNGSNNTGDGSQENPLETIQLAIDISSNGDSVTVGPGVYNENISWFNKNLTIMGAGSEETIIDAQQLDNGVRIQNIGNTSLFEGFTIKNGTTVFEDWPWANGGGICMINSHATLRDIIVEDCVLQDQDWDSGNGIFVGESSSLFEDVIVRNNEGGGIFLHASDSYPMLKHVTIEGNTNGFGMQVYDTGVMMDSSEVVNNPAGGIWYTGVGFNPSVYSNSLFHNNGSEGSQFGAIEIKNSGATATFDNCTFYGNQSYADGSDIYSEGLYFNDEYYGNDITIVSSVFYNEQESSIYLQPTDYADTLNISYSNLLTAESIHSDNVNYIEIGDGMVYGDPLFCDAENGDYSISLVSPLIGAGSEGNSIGDLEIGCGIEPIITEVTDVPDDQGGWVYLGFSRCGYDQEGITDQLYTVYRYDTIDDTSAWVGLLSIGAIGEEHYYVEVHTTGDSTAEDSGMGTYKVVASMNEGIYHSDEMSGYSVDNIAPDMPTGMQAMAMENSIILNWDMSEAEDFQYFVLERTNEATAGVEESTISYELIDITFEDVDLVRNVEYSYRLAAYDDAGNRSEFTEPVSAILLSTDQQSLLPEAYTLHQNYPNPFNPTTLIQYDLPEKSYVSITIYDLMGKMVKLLVNSKQDAGYRSIHWNATNEFGQPVSAGMYIYTIQAGKFRQTKKMVLLK